MYMIRRKKLLGFILPLIFLGVMVSTASAAEYSLVAAEVPGGLSFPGAVTAPPAWGFCIEVDNNFATIECTPSATAPVLEVGGAGDLTPESLTIHLKNNLPPVLNEYISLQILGQVLMNNAGPVWTELGSTVPIIGARTTNTARVRSFAHEAAPNGGEATYIWGSVAKPFRVGSYLLTSGTNPAKQVQMRLFAAVKKAASATEAYTGIFYDKEVIMVYSEVDPVIHEAIAGGTYGYNATPPAGWITNSLHREPKYFLINGNVYQPGGALDPINAPDYINAGDRILFRFYNAGYETHVPQLLNLYLSKIAEDGNPYSYPKERYGVQLPAGKTVDAIVVMPATMGRFSISDAVLRMTDAGTASGGNLAFVSTEPCLGDIEPIGTLDGDVDGLDFFLLLQDYGRTNCITPGPACPGDIEPAGALDGAVNGLDLATIAAELGRFNCPN